MEPMRAWIVVTLLLAAHARAAAQPAEDDEVPPALGGDAPSTDRADDDEMPILIEPEPRDTGPLEPPPRLWSAGIFVGYSAAGLLGLEVERVIAGPFAFALAGGLYPRAELGTWTGHGGASLRARFFRDAAFHIALDLGIAYGDEGRGTEEDPKFTGILYLAGALHLEVELDKNWFLRLAPGFSRALAFRKCSSDACRSNPNDPTDRGLPSILVTIGNRF